MDSNHQCLASGTWSTAKPLLHSGTDPFKESEGFEPSDVLPPTVFRTVALIRSANLPKILLKLKQQVAMRSAVQVVHIVSGSLTLNPLDTRNSDVQKKTCKTTFHCVTNSNEDTSCNQPGGRKQPP